MAILVIWADNRFGKSVCPFFFYEDGDTAPFKVSGPGGEDLGFVSFTKELRHLGPIAYSSLTSDADVDKYIRSAAAAFVALRGVLCNSALEEALRGQFIRPSC